MIFLAIVPVVRRSSLGWEAVLTLGCSQLLTRALFLMACRRWCQPPSLVEEDSEQLVIGTRDGHGFGVLIEVGSCVDFGAAVSSCLELSS